jgi:hypothetical protein
LREPSLYFAPKAITDLCLGFAFFGSCYTRMPLAAIFARELLPLPADVYRGPAIRSPLIRITYAWSAFYTVRGAVTLTALHTRGPDAYVLAKGLFDSAVIAPLAVGSLAYGLRALRGVRP